LTFKIIAKSPELGGWGASVTSSETLEEAEELDEPEEFLEAIGAEITLPALPFQQYDSLPALQIGDWVLLKAEPRLTAAELIAVWEVEEIQGEHARIEAKGLGHRLYPIAWMVIYPELEF
jgi:hypothetical protein